MSDIYIESVTPVKIPPEPASDKGYIGVAKEFDERLTRLEEIVKGLHGLSQINLAECCPNQMTAGEQDMRGVLKGGKL